MLFRDSGQVAPLFSVLLVAAATVVFVIAQLGARAADQARAQTAADAAALAGVIGGLDAAARLAGANSGVLVEASVDGTVTAVAVTTGEARARAHAQPLEKVAWSGLDQRLVEAIGQAERLLGEPLAIVSGLRSRAGQQVLWEARYSNPYPVAEPGTSSHERGLAIDVDRRFVARLRTVAPLVGLCQPLPSTDPVHFELCRTTATR
jgi:hypothetical protein